MHSFCRTCLSEISDNFLSLTEDEESLRVKTELTYCIPEVDVDLVIDPVMCFACVNVLHSAYKFKSRCLETEEHISNYMRNMNSNGNGISPPQVFGKVDASSLQSCITTASNTSIKVQSGSMTRDIIDDLNSLLDEALQNTPTRYEIFGDKNTNDGIIELERNLLDTDRGSTSTFGEFEAVNYEEFISQPHELSENNNQSTVAVQNNMAIRECFVKCVKLPDNFNYSNINLKSLEKLLVIESAPQLKDNLGFNNESHQNGKRVFRCGVEKRFLCNMCDYRAAYFYLLKRHSTIHLRQPCDKKVFVCKICNKRYARLPSLKKHMHIHTADKPFSCNICSFESKRKSDLQKHIMHSETKSFSCNTCSFTTAYKQSLKRHIMEVHTAHKTFSCYKCNFTTIGKNSLKKHMQMHTVDRQFSCNICSFSTSYKTYLKIHHRRVHTDEKPFGCNFCSFRTKSKSYLKIHLCCHSGKTPWSCKICNFKTTIRAYLKRHEILHCRT